MQQEKDILYVKKILGHKRIENTLKYIDLEAMIFKPAIYRALEDAKFTAYVLKLAEPFPKMPQEKRTEAEVTP